jgi:hypothetical protein
MPRPSVGQGRLVAVAASVALSLALVPAAGAATAASPPIEVTATPITKALSSKGQRSTITVRNASRGSLGSLRLQVSTRKGVRIALAGAKGRSSRRLATLRAGRAVKVGVTLRRAKGGPTKGQLTVRVRRAGKSAATTKLTFGRTTTAPEPTTLAGRYFWGSRYTLNGIVQNTLYFTGKDLVWVDDVEGTFPTCTAVSEQCKPYAYDPKSKALTIDGKPATLEGRGIEWDGDRYREWGVPPAGTRWDTTVTYSNSSGICPLYCSYFTEHLTFRPDGTFARDAVASGSGPVVDWASVPPNRRGTYEVRADGTLRLAFADGSERVETVAQYRNDDGSLQPAGEGLLLNGDGYFDIRD